MAKVLNTRIFIQDYDDKLSSRQAQAVVETFSLTRESVCTPEDGRRFYRCGAESHGQRKKPRRYKRDTIRS